MTIAFRYTLIWLAGSFVAILMALNTLPGSLVDGKYIPVGNDSFYHARRILDAAPDGGRVYEFDTRIHAPEGSQVPWPWAYDFVIAKVVRTIQALGIGADPMTTIAYIPVAAIRISIALLVGIAIVLDLSPIAALITVLCVALSPLTQVLHGVGVIDHHYAEYIFVLGSLLTGIAWLQAPHLRWRAALAGCVLGWCAPPGWLQGCR